MHQQISNVLATQGREGANDYARRVLHAYRNAARDRNHHAHALPFRPHFVRAILELRAYIRGA